MGFYFDDTYGRFTFISLSLLLLTQRKNEMKNATQKTEVKRFEVFEVGFRKGSFDNLDDAIRSARSCYEYAYVIDNETGEEAARAGNNGVSG